jgi:hypothetical protein
VTDFSPFLALGKEKLENGNSSSPDEFSILRRTGGKFISVGVRISGHSVIAHDKSPLRVMLMT